jgi:Ca-activated chloride channel family protein
MSIERPWVLAFLLVMPVLAVLLWWSARSRRAKLELLVSASLQPRLVVGVVGDGVRAVLTLAALTLGIVALAGVHVGSATEEVKARGVDVMVALDVSDSMLARDVESDAGLSRLERAKREILDLIGRLDGDRIGLVIFAGDAVLQLPLTLDYEAAAMFVRDVQPELVSAKGTAIASALDASVRAFDASVADGRAVVLITDGEDTEGDVDASADKAKAAGVHVFCIGVGRAEGAPIPVATGGFRRDNRGEMVLSKLDEAQLHKIASITDGDVVRSTSGDYDLERIYVHGIKAKIAAREMGMKRTVHGKDRYRWLVSFAALGFVVDALVRARSKR